MRKSLAIAAFALIALTAPASAQSDAAESLEAIDDPEAIESMADQRGRSCCRGIRGQCGEGEWQKRGVPIQEGFGQP